MRYSTHISEYIIYCISYLHNMLIQYMAYLDYNLQTVRLQLTFSMDLSCAKIRRTYRYLQNGHWLSEQSW